jgi:AdoMet-dependent rRNA methyltransferase SPB1
MPTTETEKRKDKRKKAVERQERREQRREDKNRPDADNGTFDVIVRESSNGSKHSVGDDDGGDGFDEDLPADVLEHRDLIKRGMGAALHDETTNPKKKKRLSGNISSAADVEVVPRGATLTSHGRAEEDGDDPDGSIDAADERLYDSDHEDYDSHDRAMTLALGTLMLRRSKQKALVDASYNRFSWNDSKDLPTWFVDDEMKHNKPQLPVPDALMNQIKSRFQLTGTKEIKKVAEARARKRKRALTQLKKAKKQATVMAENSELSEKQKLKAISKAMRTSKVDKPGKVYVVAHKTKAGSVGTSTGAKKGKLKFVDARMRKDARAMKQKQKGKKRKH